MKTVFCFLGLLAAVVTTPAQPALRVEVLSGTQVRLSWPESAERLTLERSLALGGQADWQATGLSPALAGGRFEVVLQPDALAMFFRLRGSDPAPARVTIAASSPFDGETGVAVTRETILRLSGVLAPTATVTVDNLHAEFGGRRILARPAVSHDRRTLTLFYLETLPASARVVVRLMGDGLLDVQGESVDADGDGDAGGVGEVVFYTSGISGHPDTGITGRVFASEKNPDGSNLPLANVTVTVDGAEEVLRTTTDATGAFRLRPAPAGRFFVHVDGRTARGSEWPGGAYYPFVGKAWETIPGKTNNLAGGTGEIFLPLIRSNALQSVSATETTRIGFGAADIAANPGLGGVEVVVPPNALFADQGNRGGRVGLAAVPPDRLPEPLPPGLRLPLVITIQTDGPQNFDRPVPVRFPNLPDPLTGAALAPGAKTVLWSFNHDTGRWEAQGTATVSADGLYAETDPGVGVRQPGWHGVAPGSPVVGPPRPPLPSECGPDDCPPCVQTVFCDIPTPGRPYVNCALKCLGDVMDDLFGDGPKPKRTAFESGLRCIGGPDTCPSKPEDTLSKERRECMDECQNPDPKVRVFVLPCEGVFSPCPSGARALRPSGGDGLSRHEGEDLLPDRFEEQRRFWQLEGDFLVKLTGTPKILQSSLPDVPKLSDFFDAFAVRVRSESPAGMHLSPQERAELIALARPTQFSEAEWTAMIDRLDALQGAPVPADLAAANQALEELVAVLKQRGWRYRLDGLVHGWARLSRVRAPQFGSADFPVRSHFFLLRHHRSGIEQRGRLSETGQFEGLVLAPGDYYTVAYLDAATREVGAAFFQAFETGAATVVPSAPLEPLPPEEPDEDADGLPDFAEQIVGTMPGVADTDGDGVTDGREIVEGSNPLDGVPPAQGLLAVLDTPGVATDICAWDELAAIADGTAGVLLADVSNPQAPVRLAQVDTPGEAVGVAGSGSWLAVADQTEGVTILDVSVPSAPALLARTRFSRQARAVAIVAERVVVGLASGALVLLDASGQVLFQTTADNLAVQDLLVVGGVLYVLKVGFVETWGVAEESLAFLDRVSASGVLGAGGKRLRLASDGTRLFATHSQGYSVYDVSLGQFPQLLRHVSTTQFGWRHVVPDAHGRALAAVDANSTDDGPHDVSLYAVGAEGAGTNFVATFRTPGIASALSFYRGVAWVADGAAGLSVVRHVVRDSGTAPPTLTLRPRFAGGAGSLEDGARFLLLVDALDDQLVSHVEFYLEDQLVAVDGNPPFEIELEAPTLGPTKPTFVVGARAFDTAGNVTSTAGLVIDPSTDQTAPRVTRITPDATERFQEGNLMSVSVRFDEPIATNTLGSGWTLMETGADGLPNTPDDRAVPAVASGVSSNQYVLVFEQPLAAGDYAMRLAPTVADLAGNPLGREILRQFRIQVPARFVATTGLVWSAASDTTNRWSSGRLPTAEDFVRIDVPGVDSVRVQQQVAAYRLDAATGLIFENGSTLRLVRGASFESSVTLRGTTWQGGEVWLQGETLVAGAANLRDLILNNRGHLAMQAGSSLGLFNSVGLSTWVRNLAGGRWEMVDSQLAVFNTASKPADFVNEGLLVARGTDRNFIGSTRMISIGSVEVREGVLEIRAGGATHGPSQHLGEYRVDAGATLLFTGMSEFGRATRLWGPGNVTLTAARFPGSYEIDGSTALSGEVIFSGSVQSRGPWTVKGAHAIFTGLNPQITGPVSVEGALTVAVEPLMHLSDLQVYRDLTVNSALEVHGPLRLDSTSTPSGGIAAARLLGSGRLRSSGTLLVAGTVGGTGAGRLEIAGSARSVPGAHLSFGASGYEVRVLSGGSLDLSGFASIVPRGPLVNEGELFKTDAAATVIAGPVHNQGLVRLGAGTLAIQNGQITQNGGHWMLEGGNLELTAGVSSSADATVRLLGGRFQGAGRIQCSALTNAAELAPGSPVGVLELRVEDHPTVIGYEQAPTGRLILDVAGLAAGTGFDQVAVTGQARLAGTLELRVRADFDAPVGAELRVLTCSGLEGVFTTVSGGSLSNGNRLEVTYDATGVVLRVVAP